MTARVQKGLPGVLTIFVPGLCDGYMSVLSVRKFINLCFFQCLLGSNNTKEICEI